MVRYGGKLEPKPVLIFVPSRRQTRLTAVDLLTLALADKQENRFCHMNLDTEPLKSLVDQLTVSYYEGEFISSIKIIIFKDESLRATVRRGVGFLHEGTTLRDSEIVQTLFISRAIQVLYDD